MAMDNRYKMNSMGVPLSPSHLLGRCPCEACSRQPASLSRSRWDILGANKTSHYSRELETRPRPPTSLAATFLLLCVFQTASRGGTLRTVTNLRVTRFIES